MSVPATEITILEKCLVFCQTLKESGIPFSINLKAGTMSFSLDTREKEKEEPVKKRRISPSKKRRNERRMREFLAGKESSPTSLSPSISSSS